MGKDKDKWAELVKYLNNTDAKPEKVLNLVKQKSNALALKKHLIHSMVKLE